MAALLWTGCGAEEPGPSVPAGTASESEAREAPAGDGAAPLVESVRLHPDAPVPGQSVEAEVRTGGTPAHATTLAYEWFVNGQRQVEIGSRLRVPSGLDRGARIEVSVVARHAEQRSAPARASARVGNSAPVLHRLVFEPALELMAGQDLRVIPKATDADGDELEYDVEWWVNEERVRTAGEVLPGGAFARGDSIRVRVRASDGDTWSDDISSDPLEVRNAPPRITSNPGGFDDLGRFVYSIAVEDADGDRGFAFRLAEGPEGMALDPADGTLRWSPSVAQAGQHPVRIEVDDRRGGVATQAFVLELGFETPGEAVPAAADDAD